MQSIRITGTFVSFCLTVLKFVLVRGGVVLGDGDVFLSSFGIGLKDSVFDILFSNLSIALFFRRRISRVLLKFIDLSRQAGKFVSFSLSVLKFVPERGGVVLGDGGGYLAEVEVHGEDEHGELGGGGADPD